MLLTVAKKELTEAVKLTATGKGVRILEAVRLTAKDGVLTLDGFDGEVYTSITVNANIQTEGRAVVFKKQLSDALKNLKDKMLTIKVESDALFINNVKLPALDEAFLDEFANRDEASITEALEFTMPSEAFFKALNKVKYAMSKENERFTISSVCITDKAFVATDGYRLAVYNTDYSLSEKIVIPSKTVLLLSKIKTANGDVRIKFNKEQACFITKQIKIFFYISEGVYPDYKQVIPKDESNKVVIKVNKEQLITALRNTTISDDRKSKPVILEITDNKLKIKTALKLGRGYYSYSVDNATFYTETEIDIELLRNEAGVFKIGFNSNYLIDAISGIEGDAIIKFVNADTQITILDSKDDNYLALVMPMTVEFD
jgi:DNA polymerase-3 subunit beta